MKSTMADFHVNQNYTAPQVLIVEKETAIEK